jgi:site-specific DNA recombinase
VVYATIAYMKTALYLRQSLDKTGEGLAVDRQREDTEAKANQLGWTVVRTEVDNDLSAKGKKARPRFEAILTAIGKGEIQAVVAWDMTRLTRNARDTLRIIETGQRHNTVLAFHKGESLDLSSPNGRMVAHILAAVAQQEIEQKSERQIRANLQAAKQGRRMGGRRPFGFEQDMTIRESEAAAIRQAYDDVLAGVSLGQVARNWNAAGFYTPLKTRKGEPSRWTGSSVRPVLLNPRNAGIRGYGPKPENGSRTIEEMGKAKWDAIVSEETWRAVVGLLSDPDRFAGKGRGARALLSGIGLCGVCGATVEGGRSRTKHRIYRCSGSWGHISRAAEPVEEWVSEVAIARLSRDDAAELLRDDHRPDIEALRSEATALRTRLDQLATEFADGVLTSSQLRTATSRARSKLAAAESRMADAGRTDVLGPLVLAKDVRAAWAKLGTERQRGVIDALMVVRLMSPGRGNKPFKPETVITEPRV